MFDIERLADWLKNSNYITLLSGAGMSTEVGAIDDISLLASGWQNQKQERHPIGEAPVRHDPVGGRFIV